MKKGDCTTSQKYKIFLKRISKWLIYVRIRSRSNIVSSSSSNIYESKKSEQEITFENEKKKV